MANTDIVGIWQLVAIERPTADGSVARDDAPHGFLLYDASGWFAESFSTHGPDGNVLTVLYCGTWETDGDSVFHIPAMHADPANIGKRLQRQFVVDGDRFTLISGPVRLHGERLR